MALTVLVVDDDFRVARLHADIVRATPGFAEPDSCASVAEAMRLAARGVDLALVDLYLPDGSGLELVRSLDCDVFVLSAAAEAGTVRTALSRGALAYLVKPFGAEALSDRLGAYRRYRALLDGADVVQQDAVDAAIRVLHGQGAGTRPKGHSALTEQAVAQAVAAAGEPVSAAEVAEQVGISRATAQRYLALLADQGRLDVQLRYGTTGRPEHRFSPVRAGAGPLS
ncbi:response regulator [Nakamurella leprariae]|uniref:Transcriptional regulatory protein n=1 Tax=Nakamurella leprariae TaxID=2803911 RepID=A0A938YFC7_9ACTN|nr:response regulator [Nakamurella leprariae]MBM9468553.1 response regulator [Nakamurella leprariae]